MVHEELIAASEGVRLNVARTSTEPPDVVLWHGLIRRWQDYAPLLPSLASRWSVAAIDHRGHGKSSRGAGKYRVADYSADAVLSLRSIAKTPAVLYGHSLGALTALSVAAECPDLVKGIVLEDPPSAAFLANVASTGYGVTWKAMRELARAHKPIPETAKAIAAIRLPNGRTLGELRDPAALRFLAKCLADLDPETITPALEGGWLEGFDVLAVARKVRCPVLLLAGDPATGGMLPTADADAITAALADVCRVEFPGGGHLMHVEHPAAVAQVLLPFLESL